jgi:hypothetical protein
MNLKMWQSLRQSILEPRRTISMLYIANSLRTDVENAFT